MGDMKKIKAQGIMYFTLGIVALAAMLYAQDMHFEQEIQPQLEPKYDTKAQLQSVICRG